MAPTSVDGANVIKNVPDALDLEESLLTLCAENRRVFDSWTEAIIKFHNCQV